MSKMMLLGLILLLFISLGTFSVAAVGYEPDFFENNHRSGNHGGCFRFNDDGQESFRGRCYESGENDCDGLNAEECEEYCEENGYSPEDCPRGNDDCPNSGQCY
ncbi:hypothetical protein [[Eubacterium] cellulosolvens]